MASRKLSEALSAGTLEVRCEQSPNADDPESQKKTGESEARADDAETLDIGPGMAGLQSGGFGAERFHGRRDAGTGREALAKAVIAALFS
jgi:hypothetical protein